MVKQFYNSGKQNKRTYNYISIDPVAQITDKLFFKPIIYKNYQLSNKKRIRKNKYTLLINNLTE